MPEIVPTVTETPIQAEVPIYNEAISVTGLATPADIIPEVVQSEQNQDIQQLLQPFSSLTPEAEKTPI